MGARWKRPAPNLRRTALALLVSTLLRLSAYPGSRTPSPDDPLVDPLTTFECTPGAVTFGKVSAWCYTETHSRGVAQSGSALEWGSSGRTFKSSRPDRDSQLSSQSWLLFFRPATLYFLSSFVN